MKKFTALFVFTVLSAGQALKIQEKIVEQVREELLLGASPVPPVTNGIQNLQSSVQQYFQSVTTNTSQAQKAINQLTSSIQNANTTAQQAINLLISSIQSQNISFSTISQELVKLKSSLSPYLSSSAQASQNIIGSSTIQSQLNQLSTDFNYLVSGNYWGTSIVTLQGCWVVNSDCNWSEPSTGGSSTSQSDALTKFKNSLSSVGFNNMGWYSDFPYYQLQTFPRNPKWNIRCSTNPGDQKFSVFIPMQQGPLLNSIFNQQ